MFLEDVKPSTAPGGARGTRRGGKITNERGALNGESANNNGGRRARGPGNDVYQHGGQRPQTDGQSHSSADGSHVARVQTPGGRAASRERQREADEVGGRIAGGGQRGASRDGNSNSPGKNYDALEQRLANRKANKSARSAGMASGLLDGPLDGTTEFEDRPGTKQGRPGSKDGMAWPPLTGSQQSGAGQNGLGLRPGTRDGHSNAHYAGGRPGTTGTDGGNRPGTSGGILMNTADGSRPGTQQKKNRVDFGRPGTRDGDGGVQGGRPAFHDESTFLAEEDSLMLDSEFGGDYEAAFPGPGQGHGHHA